MLRGDKVVAESTFTVTSDEWLLLKPSFAHNQQIIGDTLVVQENTDVDSISISFGGGINSRASLSDQKKLEFNAFRVVDADDP